MIKKVLFLCLLGLTMLFAWSCSKEAPITPDGSAETTGDVYYIKYASNGIEGTYDASYTNEKNETVRLSNLKGADFERTIGPVAKGFKATFRITSSLSYTTVAVRIEVRKGNEPFMVKKEAVNTSSGSPCTCSVSYTVEDY